MGAKLGGGGGSRYTIAQNSDINVTPFVDVMLVLLIIFMVSIPAATVSIKLDLPPAKAPPRAKRSPIRSSSRSWDPMTSISGHKRPAWIA